MGSGKEAIFLFTLYHFHPLHRHIDVRRAITAKSSPLHVANQEFLVSEHKLLLSDSKISKFRGI